MATIVACGAALAEATASCEVDCDSGGWRFGVGCWAKLATVNSTVAVRAKGWLIFVLARKRREDVIRSRRLRSFADICYLLLKAEAFQSSGGESGISLFFFFYLRRGEEVYIDL